MCVYACAYMSAIFIITHSTQSLPHRHSGLSDRVFTPSNSYGAASAGRDTHLNGSKTSLVPAETQYKRRGKEFYGASDSTLAKSRLIAVLYCRTCANNSCRRKTNRFVQSSSLRNLIQLPSSVQLTLLLGFESHIR